MRKLSLAMNVSLDGYIAAPGDDLGWSAPSDELFQWQEMPKVVFSSTIPAVDWNARLVTGDAVAEIGRLKAAEEGVMEIVGATLAGAVVRAGLVDEFVTVTHPVLVGAGTRMFPTLDRWVSLDLVGHRTFPCGVSMARYEARR